MRVQILGVDFQRLLELLEGLPVPALEVEQPAQLVSDRTVARVLLGGDAKVVQGDAVVSARLLGQGIEVVNLRAMGIMGRQ